MTVQRFSLDAMNSPSSAGDKERSTESGFAIALEQVMKGRI
jgi:hypothetical protein